MADGKIPEKSFKPDEFESKWQKIWADKRVYQPDLKNAKKPFYNLMMFPYPSAEGLHVGNMYAFTGADIYGRFKRMQGYDVFEPIGLDGFGIHSENYAIKIGKHPAEQAKISQKNFYRQLHAIGNGFAFENHLETYDPDYYRWTQWIFVQMFKHGLAYRKKSPVNFCPSCKTVLSDEQVINKVQSSKVKVQSLGNNREEIREVDVSVCERCGTAVEKRDMEQWYFRITDYAERLLNNIETLEWTNKVKIGQRNWIGKKTGINVTYPIDGTDEKVMVFTTAPVNFGMTFLVLSAEHTLVKKIIEGKLQISSKIRDEIKKYVIATKKKSEMERISEGREKTGVFTGLYALNRMNMKKVPVYVTDFVLSHVGTGAVQGCPGHDKKDFQFAKKFGLPIIRVVVGEDGDDSDIVREEQVIEKGTKGHFVNSEFLNGLPLDEGLEKTMDYFEEKGWGKRVTTYKLRDWCISRQRYWGAPIPMIFCKSCAEKGVGWQSLHEGEMPRHLEGGPERAERVEWDSFKVEGSESNPMPGWFPVSEEDLPVLLPSNVKDWKPEGTGKGPLAKIDSFVNVACPECGSAARRETDVCDTFLDSSWYHMRYPSVNAGPAARQPQKYSHKGTPILGHPDLASPAFLRNSLTEQDVKAPQNAHAHLNLPWDPEITRRWLPVTQYIGGAEHTVLHLLYARFVTMVFKDLGFIDFEEPYTRFYAHGLIIAEGAKMSKSRGNVVIPDDYISKYGADTLRTYLMFLGPFDAGGDFRDTGIAGMHRFLSRVWRLVTEFSNQNSEFSKTKPNSDFRQLTTAMHKAIKEVSEDLENFRYNTAIAHIMEYVNQLSDVSNQQSVISQKKQTTDYRSPITDNHIKSLLLMLAPFAPHMTEELWQQLLVISCKLSVISKIKTKDQPATYNSQPTTFQSVHLHPWPTYDPAHLVEDYLTIIVQVNGKVRDTVKLKAQSSKLKAEVESIAKKSEKVTKYLFDADIKKVVFIPGKLINFVV